MNIKNILINTLVIIIFISYINPQKTAYCFADNSIQNNQLDAKEENREQYDEIAKVHSDYREIAQDVRFTEYIDSLPLQQREEAERIIGNGSVEEVIGLLSDYKRDFLLLEVVDVSTPMVYVEDSAGLIDSQTESRLNTQLTILEGNTGVQIIALTTDSTGGIPISQYSHDVANKWKHVRFKKENGVIIVIAIKEGKYIIKVGAKLDSVLPKDFCADVGKTLFIPNFKAGNFSGGIYEGVTAIIKKLTPDKVAKVFSVGDKVTLHNPSDGVVGIFEDISLKDLIIQYADGITATILDVKIIDKSSVIYKVQVWENVGWISGENIVE